jgi:hypothetical protein
MRFVPARCNSTLWGEMGFRKIEGGHVGELQDVRETHWHFRCSEQPIRRPRPPWHPKNTFIRFARSMSASIDPHRPWKITPELSRAVNKLERVMQQSRASSWCLHVASERKSSMFRDNSSLVSVLFSVTHFIICWLIACREFVFFFKWLTGVNSNLDGLLITTLPNRISTVVGTPPNQSAESQPRKCSQNLY